MTSTAKKNSTEWRAVLDDIIAWSREQAHDAAHVHVRAAGLRNTLEAAALTLGENASWSEVLQVNLAVRLQTLVTVWEELRALRGQIEAGLHSGHHAAIRSLNGVSPRVLVAMLPFMTYVLLFSTPIAAIYLTGILPAIHSFEMLVLVTVPVFVPIGAYIARPTTAPRAMALMLGIISGISLQDTGNGDLGSFINGILAQSIGMGAAVLATALLRSVSADWTARRLLRAGWTELSAIGKLLRPPSVTEMSARMLDRIGLLAPRLALASSYQDLTSMNALRDLRVGLNMSKLLSNREAASSVEFGVLMDE